MSDRDQEKKTGHENKLGLTWLKPGMSDREIIERQNTIIIIMAGAVALFFIVALVQTLTKAVVQRQLDLANSYVDDASDSAGGYRNGLNNLQEYIGELQLSLNDEKKRSDTLQKQVDQLKERLEAVMKENAGEETEAPGTAGAAETEAAAQTADAGTDAAAPGEAGDSEASDTEGESTGSTADGAKAAAALKVAEDSMEAQLKAERTLAMKAAFEKFEEEGIATSPKGTLRFAVAGSEEGAEGEEGDGENPDEESGEGKDGEGEEGGRYAERGQTTSSPTGVYRFTDKNGDKATFTSDEWEYLLSIWEYTGKAQEMLEEHTIGELKSALATR